MSNILTMRSSAATLNELVVDVLDPSKPSSQAQLKEILRKTTEEEVIKKALLKIDPDECHSEVIRFATSKVHPQSISGLAFNQIKRTRSWRLRRDMYDAVSQLSCHDFTRRLAAAKLGDFANVIDIEHLFQRNKQTH